MLYIAPFEESHLAGAAELLAARHARDRARQAALPAAYDELAAMAPLLEQSFRQEGASGVVALLNDELAGFLLATPMLPTPTQLIARFYPPRSMTIPYQGHALAPNEDPALHRQLYEALAEEWLRRGFFEHVINVPAHDRALADAWHSLGFGREVTCAIADVASAAAEQGATADSLEIHQATSEDIAVIEELAEVLWDHHTSSPIFAPNLLETRRHERELELELLVDEANAHFVAYRNGTALGMNTFMTEGFLPPSLTPEACVYLWQSVVQPEARRAGVGRALLTHTMEWAQAQGHRWCALHYYSANVSGAQFWERHGFRPLEYRLRRHIDERIAWAS